MNLIKRGLKWLTNAWYGESKENTTDEMTIEEAWASLQDEIMKAKYHPNDLETYFLFPERLSADKCQQVQLHLENCAKCREDGAYFEAHKEHFRLENDEPRD